jgi:bifunctional non-homologous end joining protein LigD
VSASRARSGAAADGLAEYERKRDFTRTPEPRGDAAPATATARSGRFVVQRHRARRLHYDFRLEAPDGALVSWAVPKGVTLDPSVKSLAIHTEDHPLDYLEFEGVIPKGEYGGGDVIVWDVGTYELHRHADLREAIAAGEVHAELFGQKLRGRVVLVRTRMQGSQEQWLVLHKRDEHAVEGWDPEEHPQSVLSGRTNDEVAAAPESIWTSDGEQRVRREIPTFDAPTEDELAALDALGEKGRWRFQGRDISLTNLDKVLFPGRDGEEHATKRELVRYHACIAPTVLPYLVDRPLNVNRYPDGAGTKGFWQKQIPSHAPDWIARWRNEDADEDETETYMVADSPPALVWLANQAAFELHPWTSRIPDVRHPTYALVDIDPGDDTTQDELLTLARLHKTALEHVGVRGYPKTSGRRGIQVWIPIVPGPTFTETRAWVEQLSKTIGAVVPDLVSWAWEKQERGGRARLDFTQNAINKTLVAPYSVRPAAGAPVSVPITWSELDGPDFRSDRWTIRDVMARLADVGDPMAPALTDAQVLPSLT